MRTVPSGRRAAAVLSFAAAFVAAGISVPAQTPPPAAGTAPPAQDPPPAPGAAQAAQDPARTVVVTASRSAQDPFTAPRSIDVVSAEDMRRQQFRTLPQALRNLPGTMIQETAPGQGSPFLRGFTGYGNLLLIDGVRLNNSTFRSGPNQYWATIDPLSLERIEVLRGPAGALYGSDAVGGTVQVFTKSPTVYGPGPGLRSGGALFGRYATAEDSTMARAEVQAGQTWADGQRTGFLLGGDSKAFGELDGGHATGLQPNTDHEETALDAKVEHWFDAHSRLVFLHQRVRQDGVPRTHATAFAKSYAGSAVGTDQRRDLDQNRQLTYLQYHATALRGPVQAVHWSVSWQQQEEHEDRVLANGQNRVQGFDVDTTGTYLQLESDLGSLGRLSYGFDHYHDDVNSFARRSGTPSAADRIQGAVADDATYDLFGVFLQDAIALGERAELQFGARYSLAMADANSVRDPQSGQRIALRDTWEQVVANAHLRLDLVEDVWNLYGGAAQGFRAPTLSDLSSFDTARSGEQEIAAPGLDEETYTGYEVGTKVRSGRVHGQLTYYYTDIEDQIQRFPVDPSGQPITVTKANVGDGWIEGIEFQYGIELWQRITFYGANSWQYGRVANFNSGQGLERGDEYPSRLMPFTSLVGLRWEDVEGRFHASTDVLRAEDADKLSAGDQRDTQRIPPGGTPGYTIWNLRAGWHLDERTDLEVALENVTDVDYRVHGSGTNSPGRNLVVGMTVRF
jgi:hemoglobin/transferrin/lactoferrin receptor protein